MVENGLNRTAEAGPAAGTGGVAAAPGDALSKAWSARVDALVKDNQTLTRTLDGERHEKARLLSAVSRLQGENAALRETLAPAHAMSDEVGLLASALAAQSVRLETLTEHVQRLAHAVGPGAGQSPAANEAAERLHAILTSRSWRAMRPLRGLGRLARRLRS